jgi:hypothetical protein
MKGQYKHKTLSESKLKAKGLRGEERAHSSKRVFV